MRLLERTIRDRVCHDTLHQLGVPTLQLTLQFDAGWPDRLVLLPGGRPLFLEFKRPGFEPTPLQYHRLETLAGLGYDATWVDDHAIAMALIRARMHRMDNQMPRNAFVGLPPDPTY